VHGLTQPEFTVKEDNKPQPIKNFEEHSAGQPAPEPPLPPNICTNAEPTPTGGAVDVLRFDDVATGPSPRADAGDQMYAKLQTPLKLPELPVQFDLPPGNIFVRVGVRDLPSDKIGTLEVPVSVGKPQK
jgi:hypothetical protein